MGTGSNGNIPPALPEKVQMTAMEDGSGLPTVRSPEAKAPAIATVSHMDPETLGFFEQRLRQCR